MALIKCPECGQEISDKATTCPHCGTPIFVCPECRQVSVGSPTMCPKCGYMNAGQKPIVQAQRAEIDTENEKETDVVERWLKANPNEKKWFSVGMAVLQLLLFFGTLGIFLCILFFIERPFETLQEKGFDALEMVLNYKVYTRNVWILAICICTFWFTYCFLIFYGAIWPTRCGRWLRVKKIDVREALKNESQEFQSGTFSGYKEIYGYKIQNVGRACAYDMVLRKDNNNGFIALTFIRLLFAFLLVLTITLLYASAVCDMIEKNAIFGLQTELISEDNVLKIMPWFGVFMGIAILFLAVILIINSRLNKRVGKTIRQALSK